MNVTYVGQVIAQDLREEFEFFETPEGPATNDNSFMGYAIATGQFNNDTLQGACCCCCWTERIELNCCLMQGTLRFVKKLLIRDKMKVCSLCFLVSRHRMFFLN